MADKSDRKHPRYRVHLAVRYANARDFVREYAENLSAGGLFIKGATDLVHLQQVDVEIDLPGYGTIAAKAEVAHLIDAESAARFGRSAGAGLAITEAPPGFDDALISYLQRLGQRSDHTVLVKGRNPALLLTAAGYQVERIDSPSELVSSMARASLPVIGVVVAGADVAEFRFAAAVGGADDLVMAMDTDEEFDAILGRLDSEL